MSNQNETSDSKGPEGFPSSPNLERKESPNRLVADEAIDNDLSSAASLNAETAEKLHLSRDDPLLIQRKETNSGGARTRVLVGHMLFRWRLL